MSELKFKAYGELEISEALSDASHVIIEENGDVKRFPVNSIGKVKTVNGIEPDENGDVAIEVPEGFSGSWNDLSDKPFGEEDSYTTVFERTEPLSITKSMMRLDWTTNIGVRIICVCDGIEYTFDRVSEGFYFNYGKDAYNSGESPIYFESTVTMDSGGIYVKDDGKAHQVTYTVYQKVSEVITLDEKYIPKAAAVSDVTAAPTAEEFNALLAALRNAGLMATE